MRILVGLDSSAASLNALTSACRLAKRLYAPVTALYVNVGEEYTAEATRWLSISERIASVLETFGAEALQRAHTVARAEGVSLEGVMVSGIPYEEILRYAAERGIVKLIALGHSSRAAGLLEVVESTAKRVIAASPVPVFITDKEVDIRSILVAVDPSEVSKRAAGYGGKLAKLLGASVTVLSVAPYGEDLINNYRLMAEVMRLSDFSDDVDRTFNTRAERALAAAGEILEPLVPHSSFLLRKGTAADVIADEAQQYDVTVVGVKERPERRRLSKVAAKLLNARISTIYVQ